MRKKYTRREFLNYTGKLSLTGIGAYTAAFALQGCVEDIASTVTQVAQYSDSIVKSSQAVSKALDDFTPEQKYYIGRTVGAVVLAKYQPYANKSATQYVNTLGQTLAQASDLPETFNGYHMLILDSQDINAFATPAGHIFVTRGMLNCCRNEGELAAVLAHEIGHVQLNHGIDAIEKGRITEAITIIGLETTKTLASTDIAELTSLFEDSINDITSTMINSGYSRSFEKEADKSAVTIMERVGYNPAGLIDMLEVMGSKIKPGGLDFAKTHPSPESRIAYVSGLISTRAKPEFSKTQEKRFTTAMKNV